MHHKYTARIIRRIPYKIWISLVLTLALGLSFLSGCSSSPEATAQPTQSAQMLVYSPYYSTYEFETNEINRCQYLLSDQCCSILSASFSDEYLAALERLKEDPLQSIVSDESGKPLFPDYKISTYNYTGEPAATIDLSVYSPSSFQPLLALASDGNIAVLSTKTDSGNGSLFSAITVFDVNGKKVTGITKIQLDRSIVTLTDFCADQSGNYYVVGENADYQKSISIISDSSKYE